MPGLILIEIAFGLPFCILLFRAFISTVPRELDEAAIVDGAGPVQVFFRVIFPVLRSVVITVIILQSVVVYNDFANPLYFLPGTQNATVQLTLFNFRSQFTTQFNLLFANILLVMHPSIDHVHHLQPQNRRRHGRRLGQGVAAHQNSGGTVPFSQASSLSMMKVDKVSSRVSGPPCQASTMSVRTAALSGADPPARRATRRGSHPAGWRARTGSRPGTSDPGTVSG